MIVDQRGNPFPEATAHDAARQIGPHFRNWYPSHGSADTDLLPERDLMTARGRDIARNDGVASGVVTTLVDNVIGTVLKLNAKPDYELLGKSQEWADEWSRKVELEFRNYAESLDFNVNRSSDFIQDSRLMFRSAFENGDALALPKWKRIRGKKFNTAFMLVESDRLSNPNGDDDFGRRRGGIDHDKDGAAIRYWIANRNPNDYEGPDPLTWTQVKARTKFGRKKVLHVFERKRIGQSRGKTAFASVFGEFKISKEYRMKELEAACSNAMIAAFIESGLDQDMIEELLKGDSYLETRDQWTPGLSGGAVIPLFPGDKLSSFLPSRPNQAFGAFMESVIRHIAAGLNLPYEMVFKDFSKTNYSSARAAMLEGWKHIVSLRQWFVTYWAKPVYEVWLEEAIWKGVVEAPSFYENKAAYCRSTWTGPGKGWVDPAKEIQAVEGRMRNTITTLADECSEQGADWQEKIDEQARIEAYARKKNINLGYLNSIPSKDLETNDDSIKQSQSNDQ